MSTKNDPTLIIYPQYIKLVFACILSLLFIGGAIAQIALRAMLYGNHFNSVLVYGISSLFIVIGVAGFIGSFRFFIYRRPTLVVTTQGIKFGVASSLIPWQNIRSLGYYRQTGYSPFLTRFYNYYLGLQLKNSSVKPKYMAKTLLQKPIVEVLEEIRVHFVKQIQENSVKIDTKMQPM